MTTRSLTVVGNDKQQDARHMPVELPLPGWLIEGEFNGPFWVVVDSNPQSPKPPQKIRFNIVIFDPRRTDETCRLTDSQYAHLLKTIKQVLYKLRTGKYARVTSATFHEDFARKLMGLVQWMIINGIRRFANLCPDDFKAFVKDAPYGPEELFKYADRLIEHYKSLKETGGEVPKRKCTNKHPRLNMRQLLTDAAIDPYGGMSDRLVSFELLKIAQAEDCYLSPRQVVRLSAKPLSRGQRSERQVDHTLIPWFYLWLMRHELDDQIQFDPFERTTRMELAQTLGKEKGRTKTPPIMQTMELINCSLRWVLDYAPALLDLREKCVGVIAGGFSAWRRRMRMKALIAEASLPEGLASSGLLSASVRRLPSNELSFGMALLFIPTACLIVIAAFSGRRHDEVLSIRSAGQNNDDCISKDETGLWIETYIEKTIQDWVRTPCNEVAAAAVEILRRWSEPARAASTSDKLFQYKQLISGKNCFFIPQQYVKLFSDFLPITPMSDGSQWEFKPHQFRRFFAILYFWRYHYGELASLSHHLRHLDPNVTKVYLTETDSGAIFRHVGQEFTTTILTEAAKGERNISGPFGERFKGVVRRLLDHYRKTVRVVSPKLVRQTVERYVERSGRRLKAFKWGYCACGTSPQQLRTAKCLEGDDKKSRTAPDLSRSGFSTCGGCPHHATESVFKQFWDSEIKGTERAASDVNNPLILREASRQRGSELRGFYERSFEYSQPVEPSDG